MHHPHNKAYVFIHAIRSVKNREPLLAKPVRERLYQYIHENASAKGIIALKGIEDHFYSPFQMHPTQSISVIMQILKGGSAFWRNQQKALAKELKWQDGYAVYSLSPSMVKKVIAYVADQEEHHRVKLLDDELNVMDEQHLQNPTG